jgi:hypothetical protein
MQLNLNGRQVHGDVGRRLRYAKGHDEMEFTEG